MPISIYIVDDHKIFREGIASLIAYNKEIEVIGSAASFEEMTRDILQLQPDVILMDLTLRDCSGIDATKWVLQENPDARVLIFSMHQEEKLVKEVLASGAKGYLLKDAGTKEMFNAIQVVANGSSYYSPEISQILIQQLMHPEKSKNTGGNTDLTKRELEVLKLIVAEKDNREIAESLFISIRTVDTHRRNIISKLGVKNSAGLVKYAYKIGLIEL
jgi:DNA-binding NarL/FixJ family response regulator